MKKKFFFLALIFCTSFGYAVTVQIDEAKIIALNWINSQVENNFNVDDVGMVYSKIENQLPVYFIVTFKTSGWVIISGSDITEPVLGYSVNTQFDMQKIPPQVEEWMGGISKEIKNAIDFKLLPSSEIRQKWKSFGTKLVAKQNLKSIQNFKAGPLLSSTWNQGKYYNEMAPVDQNSSAGNGHVWLGCITTAMVQVMKYWGYPQTGMSNHSYSTAKYGIQSADFAN